jgi:hypothetical protein
MNRARALALLAGGVTLLVALAGGIAALAAGARRVVLVEPADGSLVGRRRPEISATFSQRVDPATVRVVVDKRDVTESAYVFPRGFVYEPADDMVAGPHNVAVSGKAALGSGFHASWSFTTMDLPTSNSINGLQPANGTRVGSAFEVTGYTRPGSRVRLVPAPGAAGGTFGGPDAAEAVETTADARGYFAASVSLPGSHGALAVQIQSTAPDGAVAVRTLRVRV